MRIHLNIGSNLGDRAAYLQRALELLAREFEGAEIHTAGPVESEPWGYDSPNPYLNLGVMVDLPAAMAPERVLDITQRVECAVGEGAPHRNADGSYRDRPVDIDIIGIDSIVLRTPRLTLPHPRAALRPFVMQPLLQLDTEAAAFVEATAAQ